ncbi:MULTISPECIES: hypothetical protein [Bradyrhizobium]|uniref:hypothetical protein n=1 Tax=Bradyrhizobium TaxID=374 RepID=UPI00155F03CD|nr:MULTISPECIES: hypothetical protein [Bradyrhizobium]MDD1517004.1 hypothetical protein [Bradyrhizobium sp. WBAH30]MDD1543173.1 hypothetical protein [Bradyrhizobium sp. WBAH41]MDD1554906.1 hypothetical protein [Bradyrhizobium sp. WBAH23]MDD1562857.1 hypothetical protein [Bradyrhizobium sp. WBAH33]MDD1590958.1 hypothetical protein [Bradyrhizobium sp. WBAH42]
MKFVVVNHEPPLHAATCSTCSRPLRSGYVRHARMQRRYCDDNCYRRGEFSTLFMQWPVPGRTEPALGNVELAAGSMIEILTVMSAVWCWSCTISAWTVARALTGACLDSCDLITMEGGDT